MNRPILFRRFSYRGYFNCKSQCFVGVFARDDGPAVVLAEHPDNFGTSVTNMSEALANLVRAAVPELQRCDPGAITWYETYWLEEIGRAGRDEGRDVPLVPRPVNEAQRRLDRVAYELVQVFAGVAGAGYANPVWRPADDEVARPLIAGLEQAWFNFDRPVC